MTYPLVEAGELMARRNGSVDPSKFKDELFELHSIPAFDAGQPELLLGSQIGSSKQIVQPGDVMISKIVPHIRRSSVVGSSTDARQIASGEWIVFRSERIFPNYLRHVLISDQFNARFMATVSGVGGSLLRARPAEVAKIKISLPPLPEQRRIAAILDKADGLRAKRREAIARLDLLLQSVFLQATADKAYEAISIGELLERKILLLHKDGNHGSQYPRKEEFGIEGIPFFSAKNLLDDGRIEMNEIQRLGEIKARQLKIGWIEAGDVLLAHNASVGKVALYRGEFEKALIGTSLTAYRPNKEFLRSEFLFMALRSSEFQRNLTKDMSQTTRNQVPITAQRRLTVRIPPIDVQDKIVQAVATLTKQKEKYMRHEASLNSLFLSLQESAFTGAL
ncbi:restriction endonuclease subunit S [Pseudomonas atacamensis]|uniref:Restriction endonuclease subunit S n=1 Tax=Pseudomonas iranensis TaxID=2745503 RepID=A0AAU7EWI5_9PSED